MTDTMQRPYLRHIRFNEDESALLCGAMMGHTKPRRARFVRLDITPPTQKRQPEEGTYETARDGKKVSMDAAVCGVHHTNHSRALYIAADIVLDLKDSPAALLDFAKRFYEAKLDEWEAAEEAQNARYRAHQMDLARIPVEAQAPATNSRRELLSILLVANEEGYDEPRPVTEVFVNIEGGVPKAGSADYLNTSGARGNLSWLRAFRGALEQAEAVMVAEYEKMELPTDA